MLNWSFTTRQPNGGFALLLAMAGAGLISLPCSWLIKIGFSYLLRDQPAQVLLRMNLYAMPLVILLHVYLVWRFYRALRRRWPASGGKSG